MVNQLYFNKKKNLKKGQIPLHPTSFSLKKKIFFLVIEARRVLPIHPQTGNAHMQQTSVFPRNQGRQSEPTDGEARASTARRATQALWRLGQSPAAWLGASLNLRA